MPGQHKSAEHAWYFVSFVYAGWTECLCGFRPTSQSDMDTHDFSVKIAIMA